MKHYPNESGAARAHRRQAEQARLISKAKQGDLIPPPAPRSRPFYWRNPRKGHKARYAERMVWNLFSGFQWWEKRITF